MSTTKTSQSSAGTQCQSNSADLASISDQDEMDFVATISSSVITVYRCLIKVIRRYASKRGRIEKKIVKLLDFDKAQISRK